MRILFIGDIVGRPGREATRKLLPTLKKEFSPNLIIANGENASHGKGLNARHAKELHQAGIDFFTSGNHIWCQPTIFELMDSKDPYIIRPANYPETNPGTGYQIFQTSLMKKVLIINLQGRVFVKDDLDCPFRTLDKILKKTKKEEPDIILVDFHAEATSEKVTLGHYAAGRVDAVIGTHTHIMTADERLLKDKTAYITDVGYVGLKNSAIGVDLEPIVDQFLTQIQAKHSITPGGPVCFNAVIMQFDEGKASSIERIQMEITP